MTVAMPDFDGNNAGTAPATATSAGLDFMPATAAAPPSSIGEQASNSATQSVSMPWQDPNVVDLRGTTKTSVDPAMVAGKTIPPPDKTTMAGGSTTAALQNDTALTNSKTADLRGTSKTAIDPATLKGTATNPTAAVRKSAFPPPAPGVQLPEDKDIEFLVAPPSTPKSAWVGPQRPANQPKLVNPLEEDEKTKELARVIFENPAMDDLMINGMMEYAEKHPPVPAPGVTATAANGLQPEKSAGPHN
jgi:hypothetical protein